MGFQAARRLFSGQADEQFCLCNSEYEMRTYVIYCTNAHFFKGGGGGGNLIDNRTQEGREDVRSIRVTMRCIVVYSEIKFLEQDNKTRTVTSSNKSHKS